ncbi:hypothetical protein ACFC26_36445 [Kitasatospora purpeofusca]|uniref:hypothetical protein n=1 Tax=Kitasatospora purpeofusca TaxID=67352 RepID=UPI0035DBAB88
MTTVIAGPPQVRRDPDLARAQAATAEAATWIEELAEGLPLCHAQSYRTMAEAIRVAGERLNPFDGLMACGLLDQAFSAGRAAAPAPPARQPGRCDPPCCPAAGRQGKCHGQAGTLRGSGAPGGLAADSRGTGRLDGSHPGEGLE